MTAEKAEQVAEEHQWRRGYFCGCGHELNSPLGFNRHLLAAYREALSTPPASEVRDA